MQDIHVQVKRSIVDLTNKSMQIRSDIKNLKWKDGYLVEVYKIRSQVNESGQRVLGKRLLRKLHRSETAKLRYRLTQDRVSLRKEIRKLLLIHGFINGKIYKSMEPYCILKKRPSTQDILQTLKNFDNNIDEQIYKESIEFWLGSSDV
jgi:hypothetical protein